METAARDRLVLALCLLFVVGAFLADVYLTPEFVLPGAVWGIPILVAALFLSPRAVLGVTVSSLALELWAGLLHGPRAGPWQLYILGVSVMGILGVMLADKIRREVTLAEERGRLVSELEATLEAAPAGVVTYDLAGRIVRMNAAAERIMGYTAAELSAPMAELVARLRFEAEGGQPLPLEQFPPARALRGEKVGSVAMAFHRTERTDDQAGQTGDRRVWIYDGAGPIRSRDGTLLGAVASFVDVTESKRAAEERERLLREVDAHRQRFQAVVEHAPVGIAVLRPPGFVFDLVNPAYQAIGPGLVMVGRTVAEVWPDLAAEVLPLLEGVARTGEPYHTVDRHFRVRRGPDASPEDVYFTFSYIPLRLPGDEATSVLVLVVETTEQVRTRQRIEELVEMAERHAAELQAVLDNMVDAVFVCAPDGSIVLTNPAASRLFGLTSFAEIRSLPAEFPTLFHLRHPDGRPIASEEMVTARALAGETVVNVDQVLRSSQGQQDRYIRVSGAPIRDAAGHIVAAVVVARDITELTELDRLKDEFIAVAAHELKTPVAIMKGYAQLLCRGTAEVTPQQRRMLDAVDRGANRIDGTVKDLLDISQLHFGSLVLTKGRVDLTELVSVAVDRFALTAGKHRVRVVRAEPVVVEGDRERLEQVIEALVDNAVRYSPQGGDVDVAVTVWDAGNPRGVGREAVVSVRDQGVGIPKDKQANIFQRFYRAHTGTPHDYGGMGVGLYIAREIVARHGGRVWFESREGQGSTFCFALPLAPG